MLLTLLLVILLVLCKVFLGWFLVGLWAGRADCRIEVLPAGNATEESACALPEIRQLGNEG